LRQEKVLGVNEITEKERVTMPEFFCGNTVKTPLRYLKIRNYIIDMWQKVRNIEKIERYKEEDRKEHIPSAYIFLFLKGEAQVFSKNRSAAWVEGSTNHPSPPLLL